MNQYQQFKELHLVLEAEQSNFEAQTKMKPVKLHTTLFIFSALVAKRCCIYDRGAPFSFQKTLYLS